MPKREKLSYECSWPGCKAKIEMSGSYAAWMESGWDLYYGIDDEERDIIKGLPEHGYLCPHHRETREALCEAIETGTDDAIERWKLLDSL